MSQNASPVMDRDQDVAVLVVDDHKPFREVLRMVVERAGGFVLVGEACSGEEATSAVDLLGPELVLMDVKMPGMGGIAAAREILARKRAPMVVLTSVDDVALGSGGDLLDEVRFVRKQDLLPARLCELWELHGY